LKYPSKNICRLGPDAAAATLRTATQSPPPFGAFNTKNDSRVSGLFHGKRAAAHAVERDAAFAVLDAAATDPLPSSPRRTPPISRSGWMTRVDERSIPGLLQGADLALSPNGPSLDRCDVFP
jgi:hypothetical protein